jgi:hypothetical protein
MTRTQALIELRDKVKAGRATPSIIVDAFGRFESPEVGNTWAVYNAYNGSLDAAKALHEAVLPGWSTEIICRPFGIVPHQWHIRLSTDSTGWGNGKSCSASNENPARAWLLAILEALIVQEGDT